MPRHYLKKALKTSTSDAGSVTETVQAMLDDIEKNGESAARRYAGQFDGYAGNLIVTQDEIAEASAKLSQKLKDDIRFAHDNIRRFAEAQKGTLGDVEIEIVPGLMAGQKTIPCEAAGCYVPGGRYSHVASAIMTVTTAKVAGCGHISVCSPPRPDTGIHPAILFAADLCGADTILAMGGVQGVASMAFGLFGLPPADILVGPGNQFVAEAKRILFGRVGIDMFAGPTDSLIVADKHADPEIVAADLVGQAEHGYNSPVWLVTDSQTVADAVLSAVPRLIGTLPDLNRQNAEAAWRDYAEIILCDSREEMAAVADEYAPEHLSVQARGPRLVARPAEMLWLAFPWRTDHGRLWRQGIGHQPCAPDLGGGALYRRTVGPQVHEDRHLAAGDRAGRTAGRRGHRPDLAAGGHGRPRAHG